MKIRIAFVVGQYPPDQRALREQAALSYASPEIEIGIVSTPVSPYIHGMSPTEIQLAAPSYIEAFREAEQQGYDAVVPLGMLDLGVDGGKSAVDIPVVGPFEACFHVASLLGDRFGLVVYHPRTIPFTRAMARRLGMESRIAGIRGVGFSLPDIAANREQMIKNFVDQARALIEQDGAEVIIPMGVTQCPVQIKPDWLQQQLGVPVVEGFGAPIRMAALLVSLGLKQSRVRWPRSGSAS
jgi:allantoin racemase